MRHIVKRTTDRDLNVSGEILVEVTGEKPGSERWTELRLYKTSGGRYVLARERRTVKGGETNIYEAVVCVGARAVLDALYDEHQTGGLGRLDKELLERAAEKDDEFKHILTENVD